MTACGTDEMENLAKDLLKITAIQFRKYYENTQIIADTEIKTFIDVMGDTIIRNLTEFIKRLGFFSSIKYNSKFQSED